YSMSTWADTPAEPLYRKSISNWSTPKLSELGEPSTSLAKNDMSRKPVALRPSPSSISALAVGATPAATAATTPASTLFDLIPGSDPAVDRERGETLSIPMG